MTNKNIVTKEDLSLVETEVSLAEKAAQIKTDVDVENAAEVLISLKTQVDAIEEKRKEYTQPAQETIDRINDDFKQLTKPRMSYITMLKEKIVEYVSIRKKEISSKAFQSMPTCSLHSLQNMLLELEQSLHSSRM